MSDAVMASWRVRQPEKPRPGLGSVPPKVWMIGGGLAASAALAVVIVWAAGQWGPRGVPVIEADGRPFKVRPSDPGGAVVPNQNELIFERGSARQQDNPAQARLSQGPEAPRPEVLRAQAAPPAPAAAAPPPPAASPAAPRGGQPPVAPPPAAQPAAAPAPARTGRVQVQLAAVRSEEAARQEWARLQRAAPELAGRAPSIQRLDRGEGQEPLFRVRTGGFPDAAAARSFCEGLRARNLGCNVVNPG